MTQKLVLFIFLLSLVCPRLVSAQTVFVTDAAYRADLKVFRTDQAYEADLLVHWVDAAYRAEDRAGLWHEVSKAYQADIKVFWVEQAYRADLIICEVKAAYRAGWQKEEKKNLLGKQEKKPSETGKGPISAVNDFRHFVEIQGIYGIARQVIVRVADVGRVIDHQGRVAKFPVVHMI